MTIKRGSWTHRMMQMASPDQEGWYFPSAVQDIVWGAYKCYALYPMIAIGIIGAMCCFIIQPQPWNFLIYTKAIVIATAAWTIPLAVGILSVPFLTPWHRQRVSYT